MKIEVFCTNVETPVQATGIINAIRSGVNDVAVNFDLDDCDKILRVVGNNDVDCDLIVAIVAKHGFTCEVLSDQVCDPDSVFA